MKKIVIFIIIVLIITAFITNYLKHNKPNLNITSRYTIAKNIEINKNFLLAVNAADQFLCSWLMRDQNRGSEFIAEELKNNLGANGLFSFFVGTSNPHHQGFEIIGSEHINQSTIRFYIWLYEDVTNEYPKPYKREKPYYIDVVKSTEYIWLVNNLPTELK
jgi:hypothetical protein